jgi:hypothetical protein
VDCIVRMIFYSSNTMKSEIIHPCPFCGEQTNLQTGENWSCGESYVHCNNCEGHISLSGTVEDAVQMWNRRPGKSAGEWWNENKESLMWTGAWQGDAWEDLSEHAQRDIEMLFYSANVSDHRPLPEGAVTTTRKGNE